MTRFTRYVLHFAYAELCESLGKLPEAHTAFDSLLKGIHSKLEVAEAGLAAEVEAVRASVPVSTGDVNGELSLERDEREKIVVEQHNKELEGIKGELGVVWVMLMRFTRRAEGLRPARTVFARSRKDKYCPWSVYEAAGKHAQVSTLA
jgi:cleavage stimulation factor subunit 3